MSTIDPHPVGGPGARPQRPDATGAGGSRGDAAHQQSAWQREMERAQLAAWFKPAPAPSTSSGVAPDVKADAVSASGKRSGISDAMPTPGSPLAGVVPMAQAAHAMPIPASGAGVSAGGENFSGIRAAAEPRFAASLAPAATTPDDSRGVATKAPPLRAIGGWGASAAQVSPLASEPLADAEPEVPSDAADAPHASTPPEATAPVRLHAEATPQGQAVWIAMRADDEQLKATLPQIVADLQRGLLATGQHLHQVVCNGRLVWRDDAAQGESTPARQEVSSADTAPSQEGASFQSTVFGNFNPKGS